jgi:putative phosphoesterase
MKIGIIADTHIPDRAKEIPKIILEDFRTVELIIHSGDLVQISVLDMLKSVCPNIKAVYGNMDPHEVRKQLPEKEILEVSKYRIGLMHGYGSPGRLVELLSQSFKNDGVDVIIFGHSHAPMNEKMKGILYFNPGSPTDKIFSPYNSYGIMEIDDKIKARIVKL